jgi:hypothetical protein
MYNSAKKHYYTTHHQYAGDQLAWKSIGSQGDIWGRRGVTERFSSFATRETSAILERIEAKVKERKYPKAPWLVRRVPQMHQ